MISNINFTLAWEVGNVEPCADALLAGFDTYTDAVLDVIMGRCVPTGRMPITFQGTTALSGWTGRHMHIPQRRAWVPQGQIHAGVHEG